MQQYASLCKVFLAYDIWHISNPLEPLHNTLFIDAVLPQKKNDTSFMPSHQIETPTVSPCVPLDIRLFCETERRSDAEIFL